MLDHIIEEHLPGVEPLKAHVNLVAHHRVDRGGLLVALEHGVDLLWICGSAAVAQAYSKRV